MQVTTRYKEVLRSKSVRGNMIKYIAVLITCLVIAASMVIIANNSNLATYKELFFDKKYIEAKEYYESKLNTSISNSLGSTNKVIAFLNAQLNANLQGYYKSEIASDEVLNLINEIKSYNLISDKIINDALYKVETTEVVRNINNLLKEGKDFEKVLKVIEDTEKKYPNLEELSSAKKEALSSIKSITLTEGKALFDEGKLEDAIAKLEGKSNYLSGDSDFEDALKNYKAKKEEIKRIEEEKRIAEEKRKEEEKRIAEEKRKEEERKKAAAIVVNTKLNRGDFATSQEFINTTNLASSNSYLIYVNLQSQTTEVFKGSRGNWNLIHSFASSTGRLDAPTPRGVYKVTGRGSWFFSEEFQQGAKWYVQFWGDYLFHSLPMDRSKNIVDSTLGTPASHGCVRLKVDEAKWLYDNIPNGATVFVK